MHFSPADTYSAQATVDEVAFLVQNNKDKLYSNKSLLLLVYGNGDGGGGPLIPMIERLERMKSLQGLLLKQLTFKEWHLHRKREQGTLAIVDILQQRRERFLIVRLGILSQY
jgi:alpha-mannosidase